ncbi:MAG: SnoaL-like domain-containing protein [Flavisolibacter sp.]
METQNFTTDLLVDQTPGEVFKAINNVRGWWSEEIEGNTERLDDEFNYHYKDMHSCKMKLVEVVPDKKVVWLVLDNYFSFTKDKSEWKGTKVSFDISKQGNKTQLRFTHLGLVPEYECYDACVNGWTQYIQHSLPQLIATGKGQPNSREKAYTIHEVALRFNELAQQEKWFEIQDELFADDVRSVEPATSKNLPNAEGKAAVRKKGEDWVKRVEAAHKRNTTPPIIAGNHFVVGRDIDITLNGIGRMQVNEIILYEVKNGKIILEQFFY